MKSWIMWLISEIEDYSSIKILEVQAGTEVD
jgi:hypothetical protein